MSESYNSLISSLPDFLTATWFLALTAITLVFFITTVAWMYWIKRPQAINNQKEFFLTRINSVMGHLYSYWLSLLNLITSQDWRYRKPYYLLIDADNDHNQILKTIKLTKKDYETKALEDYAGGIELDDGILIPCPTVKNTETVPSNDQKRLIDSIINFRPERPLDGIIVGISSEYLISKNQATTIERFADRIYKLISYIQDTVRFSMPVYVIVTNVEQQITGFKSFTYLVGEERWQEIFGWSNPQQWDANFRSSWIDSAFQEINKNIKAILVHGAARQKDLYKPMELFLFSDNIKNLHGNLSLFLTRIFKRSSFRENFYLRGFYFSGIPRNDEYEETNRPVFLNQLLIEKIFAERNLAQPTSQGMFSRNRHVLWTQLAIATFCLALFVSLFISSYGLNQQQNNLIESIDALKTNQGMDDFSHRSVPEHKDRIDALIDEMAQMDANSLKRLLIFPSYFETFDERIPLWLANNSFRKGIFPSLQCGLQAKGNSLLEPGRNDGMRLDDRVNIFVGRLKAMEIYRKWRTIFDEDLSVSQIVGSSDENRKELNVFAGLVKYVFEEDLPTSFMIRNELYSNALVMVDYPGSGVAPTCQQAPVISGDREQSLWRSIIVDADKLYESIIRFADGPSQYFQSQQKLTGQALSTTFQRQLADNDSQDFYTWVDHIDSYWLDPEQENPCELISSHFRSLLDEWHRPYIEAVGDKTVEDILEQFIPIEEENLSECETKFKDALVAQTFPLIGQFFQFDKNGQLSYTDDARQYSGKLLAARNLSFINAEISPPIIVTIDQDFFWSAKMLQEVIRYFREYEEFATEHFPSTNLPFDPDQIDDTYVTQSIILARLQLAVDNKLRLAKMGQWFYSTDKSLRPVSSQEANVAAKVSGFKKVSQPLLQIVRQLNYFKMDDSYQWLLNITQLYVISILQEVNELANEGRLYETNLLPAWDSTNPISALYNLDTPFQMKEYLGAQRKRTRFLAIQYAEPLLAFLLNSMAGEIHPYNGLKDKWQQTLVELDKSDHKDPSSHLNMLEAFLIKISELEGHCSLDDFTPLGGNDLFADNQRKILFLISNHCKDTKLSTVLAYYQHWASNFNNTLRGRYPFDTSKQSNIRMATLSAIRFFFEEYGEQNELEDELAKLATIDRLYLEPANFIARLNSVSPFFQILIDPSNQPPVISMDISFRALPGFSKGSNQIIDWRFESGDEELNFPGLDNSINWKPGEQVKLWLRWATGSPFTPINTDTDTFDNEDGGISFHKEGIWSLLSFLQEYDANISPDADPLWSPDGRLLSFRIPVTKKENHGDIDHTTVYLRMKLSALDPETRQPVPLFIPMDFPNYAPVIDSDVNQPIKFKLE